MSRASWKITCCEQGVERHRLLLLDGVTIGNLALVAEADPLGEPVNVSALFVAAVTPP
ncbi:hypothetical protein [Streptomyces sp. NPDC007205]|uniref:hypothetical protein n=1 Tax=Streptomyces sp. NPDC007205 TaxID=3154316 RepID=UPI0033C8B8BA